MRRFGALEFLTHAVMMSLGIAACSGIYHHKAQSHVPTARTLQIGASLVEPGLTPEKNQLYFTNE